MTLKELKAQRRKQLREERKIIESYLHPEPDPINGLYIFHEHRKNGYVIFRPYTKTGENFFSSIIDGKYLQYHKDHILFIGKHFYNHESESFRWLCKDD